MEKFYEKDTGPGAEEQTMIEAIKHKVEDDYLKVTHLNKNMLSSEVTKRKNILIFKNMFHHAFWHQSG